MRVVGNGELEAVVEMKVCRIENFPDKKLVGEAQGIDIVTLDEKEACMEELDEEEGSKD